MRTFTAYIKPEYILRRLVKKRVDIIIKRHQQVFYDNIGGKRQSSPISEANRILINLFPPRKEWQRIGEKRRVKAQEKGSGEEEQLLLTIRKTRQRGLRPGWLIALDEQIQEIRSRMLDQACVTSLTPIGNIFQEKHKCSKEYRAIVKYELSDNIISSITSAYLTDHVDTALSLPYFSSASYAFRSSRLNQPGELPFGYHKATADIETFRKERIANGIYVAEIDLAKFFDTINHSVLRDKIDSMVKHFELHGRPFDARPLRILENYITSFAFNRQILPQEVPGRRVFNWPAAKLSDLGVDVNTEDIGVAQGGALSCFCANLIMHDVDQLFINDDKEVKYLRYCDDFIILHTDKDRCKQYVALTLEKIRSLKLVAHSPDSYQLTDYKRQVLKKDSKKMVNEFWNSSKSKNPYRWGPVTEERKDSVPYVSFVGYQRKYDGSLRVRKKSLKKERDKQFEVITTILKKLGIIQGGKKVVKVVAPFGLSYHQIVFRAEKKLVAMSVGKINPYNLNRPLGFCWGSGFRQLRSVAINSQLRYLDRSRESALGKLRKTLREAYKVTFLKRKGKRIWRIRRALTSYFRYHNIHKEKRRA